MHEKEENIAKEKAETLLVNEQGEFLDVIFKENPRLSSLIHECDSLKVFLSRLHAWAESELSSEAVQYYSGETEGTDALSKLSWREFAAIRILDYIDHSGESFNDLNLRGENVITHPFGILWDVAHHKETNATPAFFYDMIYLFRQFSGKSVHCIPSVSKVREWMDRHPSGLDAEIVELRKKNKDRIIRIFVKKIHSGEITDAKYRFESETSFEEQYQKVEEWWDDRLFHLRFAIRNPEMLNEMLGNTLDENTREILQSAVSAGIPLFVNPYYLSLVNVNEPEFAKNADMAIRTYIFYSQELIDEFGHIVAWEREDIVEPGKPNAAGWILPDMHNVHRRYPEVAILIPSTIGRACGGLCTSCQRMYDFQRGNLNFDLDKLRPSERWPTKLEKLMGYFENDSQLRDILITGGDALMSTDSSLKRILDAIYDMALRKIEANKSRQDGEKYAEIRRIRLGTRLPVYLPQRVTPELISILKEFKEKASKINIKQFVIQTHFESAMEVTPESAEAVKQLLSAGWIVTNQQVFTAAASVRGHTAKLRKVLNEIGVLPYYTFIVKGYKENYHNYANVARAVQEQTEEKVIGEVPKKQLNNINELSMDDGNLIENLSQLKEKSNIPFLATDRNVLNLPGVGKSLTYRTIGITSYGRRILAFSHDHTRRHSPIINKMGNVIIIESKSLYEFVNQLNEMGEDPEDYNGIYGFSMGETGKRMPVYEYPEYDYSLTAKMTNLDIGN